MAESADESSVSDSLDAGHTASKRAGKEKHPPKRYHCPDCPPFSNAYDNGFRQKKQLAAHRAVVHKASSLCLPCPHPGCHRLFVCQSKLARHQRRHAVRRCPDCDAEFVGYSALRRHRALEHPAEIDCPQCGVRLACKALLKGHLNSAHCSNSSTEAGPSTPRHSCPYVGCGKAYTLARNLQQHIRSRHLGVRFPCPRPGCSYSLCTQQKLKLHLTLHDQGRVMPPPRQARKKKSRKAETPSRIGLLAKEDSRASKRRKRNQISRERQRLDSNASSVESANSSGAGHESDNSLVRLVV
ncbi:hypothetical protein BOX15_Mlig018582g2 [Macrostomum lignano]|uniref:C2H2-type domain-containing protein n=1 Tax=Macrostomum lignano TaxID=282301 RepID=A0A267GD95_9PLAT|nr:hypothetical protein BOX15_Mlig018582g2 [Macrostomum lignano]